MTQAHISGTRPTAGTRSPVSLFHCRARKTRNGTSIHPPIPPFTARHVSLRCPLVLTLLDTTWGHGDSLRGMLGLHAGPDFRYIAASRLRLPPARVAVNRSQARPGKDARMGQGRAVDGLWMEGRGSHSERLVAF